MPQKRKLFSIHQYISLPGRGNHLSFTNSRNMLYNKKKEGFAQAYQADNSKQILLYFID